MSYRFALRLTAALLAGFLARPLAAQDALPLTVCAYDAETPLPGIEVIAAYPGAAAETAAATADDGCTALQVPVVTGLEAPPETPPETTPGPLLKALYPNPSAGALTVLLARPARTLELYDAAGRRLASLDPTAPAPLTPAAGLYLYLLRAVDGYGRTDTGTFVHLGGPLDLGVALHPDDAPADPDRPHIAGKTSGPYAVTLTLHDPEGIYVDAAIDTTFIAGDTLTNSLTRHLIEVSVLAREYLSRLPNSSGLVVSLVSSDTGVDTTLVPDSNGLLSGSFPAGVYSFVVSDSDNSNLSRLRVSEANVVDSAFFIPGKDSSFVIFDYSLNSVPVALRGVGGVDRVDSVLETVDDSATLESMTYGWTPTGVAPDPSLPIYLVLFRGNPSGNPDYPPGGVFKDESINNFVAYADSLISLHDDPVIGGSPYDFRVVIADTSDISNYVHLNENDVFIPNMNVSLFTFSNTARVSTFISALRDGFYIVEAHEAQLSGFVPAEFSSEGLPIVGNVGEYSEAAGICSVRNNYVTSDCNRHLFPDDIVFWPFDRVAIRIAAGFFPYAQKQGAGFNPLIDPTANKSFSIRGSSYSGGHGR